MIPPPELRFWAASATPCRTFSATYGLPVTGTSTATTIFPPDARELLPQPAASTATHMRSGTTPRTAGEPTDAACRDTPAERRRWRRPRPQSPRRPDGPRQGRARGLPRAGRGGGCARPAAPRRLAP